MASAAVLWKTRGHVVRIGRAVEIRQMAGNASSREPRVHVVFMTLRAGHADMSPGQRKLRRRVVIERCTLPIGIRMTNAAVLRKACGHVVRTGRAVEIRQMAGNAGSREPGVHVVFVTLGTSDTDVGACQGKRRIAMVERRALPPGCGVTYAAVLRKACGRVVRIGRAVEIYQMAGDTRSRQPGEHVVFVTLGTSDVDMCASQWERHIVVVYHRRARALPVRR